MRRYERQIRGLCFILTFTPTALSSAFALCPDRDAVPSQAACVAKAADTALEAGWGLHSQFLRHACGRTLAHTECTTLATNRTHCLERYMVEASDNEGCRRELDAFHQWRTQREILAVQTHMYCDSDLTSLQSNRVGDCLQLVRRLWEPMTEDWAAEEELRVSCRPLEDSSCLHVTSGQGRLNSCLRKSGPDGCTIPPVGGKSSASFAANGGPCKVAVVSTYPPKNCGLATFTAALLARLRAHPDLPDGCDIGVIALSDPSDQLLYTDPIVHYDLRLDSAMPSRIMLEAVHFIHKAGYTHVIIQQEFGLTPIMWQLADMARWLDPRVHVFTVVHSPRATPNLEERGLLRAMSEMSERLIVMSWYGWHSLIAAYGISPDKVVYIPHGVNIPNSFATSGRHLTMITHLTTNTSLSELLANAGVTSKSRLLLSNGLLNQAKRLDRVIQAFPKVLERFPNTFFLVLGREHPTEPLAGKLMGNLIKQATALGVEESVIWLDEFVSTEELMNMIKCTSVYLTPFDESTPTSGTLLMAMANRMPVVTTPFHFALEVVQDSRGIIIPYKDNSGTIFATAVSTLLEDDALREEMGARAQAHVENWDWGKVAGQYAALIRGVDFTPLNTDPFAETPAVAATAKWNSSSIALPDGKTWDLQALATSPGFGMGAYAIYVDNDIQVNGAVNGKGELFGIGVTTEQFWVLMNHKIKIDYEWNPNTVRQGELGEWGLDVDMEYLIVHIRSRNAAFRVHLTAAGLIDLQIDIINRFASPKGILGEHYHNSLDALQFPVALDIPSWEQWHVSNDIMLSTECQGQMWGVQFSDIIKSNVMWQPKDSLPRDCFDTNLETAASPILVILEGPIFGPSGIAQVNRRYWLQLSRTFRTAKGLQKFLVMLEPQEPLKSNSMMELGVLEMLCYEALLKQSWEKAGMVAGPGVLFRNAWPPNFAQPMPGLLYIHQQAFEFQGIPSSWVEPLNNITNEIWVPSQYNAEAFVQSGIQRSKVIVVRHGIEFGKFNVPVQALPLPTRKGFKFLFNGGLLPRKGIDVLLSAYAEAFNSDDNVTLIIHSVYGDNFQLNEILDLQKKSNMPEILLFQDDLSHFEMIQLYKSTNVYVSPYRSEGFGLTVLEAMAAGLQVIVTHFGPSGEICPKNVAACLLVDADPSICSIKPCGNMTLFGQATVHQPCWSEPRVESLKSRMQEVFQDWHMRGGAANSLQNDIKDHAKQSSWFDIGSLMIQRILMQLEAYGTSTASHIR